MAKSAKQTPEVEITEKSVKQFERSILERFENIESARGTFMNRARREREAMQTIYEGMAARGFSQKATKLHIECIRLNERLKSKLAELDSEQRKQAMKLAKAIGRKEQLTLFNDLPPAEKPPKPEKVEAAGKKANGKKDKAADTETKPAGASGADIDAAAVAAGDKPAPMFN